MPIIDLADARATLGNLPSEVDAQLQTYVDAATKVVEDIVGPIEPVDVTETVDGGVRVIVLANRDVSGVAITVDDAALAGTDFTVDAALGIVYATSELDCTRFATGYRNVVITYTVEMDPVPANLILAVKEELRFLWQLGQQGNRPSFGDAPEAEEFTPSGFAVPRRVIELCGRRRKAKTFPSA